MQRGARSGFGPKTDEDTTNVPEQLRVKLEAAPAHNLSEECSVGFINYEIQNEGGKQHLASASKKMILNGSSSWRYYQQNTV